MTKAELLADLATRFTSIVQTELVCGSTENPRWYRSVVYETTMRNGIPVGRRRDVWFYALNEGQATEEAAYKDSVPPVNSLEAESPIVI